MNLKFMTSLMLVLTLAAGMTFAGCAKKDAPVEEAPVVEEETMMEEEAPVVEEETMMEEEAPAVEEGAAAPVEEHAAEAAHEEEAAEEHAAHE